MVYRQASIEQALGTSSLEVKRPGCADTQCHTRIKDLSLCCGD
jgi:hypothetical protein